MTPARSRAYGAGIKACVPCWQYPISGKTLPSLKTSQAFPLLVAELKPPFRQLILRCEFPVRVCGGGGRARQQLWCGVVCSAMGWCGVVWCTVVWRARWEHRAAQAQWEHRQSSGDQPWGSTVKTGRRDWSQPTIENTAGREQRDRQSVSPAQLRTSELTERGNRQLLLVTPLRPHSIPKAQG